MKANKPSYEELLELVNELQRELDKSNSLWNQFKDESKVSQLKSIENKELTVSVLNRIKAPLDTVVGLAKLISTANLDFEEKNNLSEIIANTATELQSIFSEFLSYNALKTHVNELNIKEVSLNELLDDLKIKFLDQVFFKDLSLRSVKGLSDEDDMVFTDREIVNQIFSSLLSNAIKFTNKGYVEMGYQVVDNELQFYVKDTGIGIDNLENAVVENQASIGLATVKQLVELLHGTLQIESKSGLGTSISFQIPYEPALEKVKEEAKKTIKVLIADDEEISFMLLKKLMQKGDVEIIRAKNGEEAYEIYKSNPDINLILMDLRMPQVDGYVAAQLIKSESPDIPIIAQSAYSFKDDKENVSKSFNGYLSKPVSKKEFEEVVNKYLDLAELN
ncbi:response regulator [Flavobacterium amnicola]|uniref:histidine kinase n=1 Tax=Flavobacterium amnicola TaxID=2506422 RepID=A0A4Q1K0Y1_9FLAO|nr:response regulator [Flavobacterium amnicola]RXR17870.1 response regulator [Flavobacterium amnicola]